MVFVGRACAVTGGAGSVFLETKSTEMTIPKADIALSAETLPTPEVSWPRWLDSVAAGSWTSDLSITSPTLNHCTTEAANTKHSNMLTWWIMSTASCKDGIEPPPARQSVVYCRLCVADRFWWLYYVAVVASPFLLQTLTLTSSYSARLGCFCDHHWWHSCCDWSSCFQWRFLYYIHPSSSWSLLSLRLSSVALS